ncbi:hypothetical protein ACHAPJ_003743 [Fusarium lateritium]
MFQIIKPLARTTRISPLTRFVQRRQNSTLSSSHAKIGWGVATLIVTGGSSLYLVTNTEKGVSQAAIPVLKDLLSDEHVSIESPVQVLDLEAANRKIRQDSHSFFFTSSDGARSRVDVARVVSNSPTEDEWDLAVGKGIAKSNTLYMGVYDGHAGWATSAVLKKALIPCVSNALSCLERMASSEAVDAAIKKAFVSLDDRILNTGRTAVEENHGPGSPAVFAAHAAASAGSCALLSIYSPESSVFRTAVTGDSRAILGSWNATADQTGFNQNEVKRLETAHPGEGTDMIDPKSGRLFGLAVTRAFGDSRLKWPNQLLKFTQTNYYGYAPRPKTKTIPYLTAEPEVTTRTVRSGDFAILASDGLWDVLSNEAAIECVSRWLNARRAGRPEAVEDLRAVGRLGRENTPAFGATPDQFAIEDLDNAAVCLIKNALGGRRREMFCGAMTVTAPFSRDVRDDITVQVIFFNEPEGKK